MVFLKDLLYMAFEFFLVNSVEFSISFFLITIQINFTIFL